MNRRQFVAGAVTLPISLRAAVDALAGGGGVALVTADTESRVAVVELATGRIVTSVPTLPGPRSVESVAARVGVVCHTAHGAVSLIEGPRLRVRRVLKGFDEPRYTAAAPNGRHAFVSDSGRREVVTVDVVRGRVVASVAVGGPARHISIDPSGRTIWVSLGSKAEQVAVVDVSRAAAPRLVRRFRPPFLAHDVGIVPAGRHVWVSSGDRGALAVYDRRNGDLLRRLPADAPPQHVTFLDGRVFVTSGDDGILRVYDGAGRLLRATSIPTGSYNVQHAFGGLILMPSLSRGTLCVADARGQVLRTLRVARSSHDACFVMSR
jgi:DNA-binding beta-propeller fold protein YncE